MVMDIYIISNILLIKNIAVNTLRPRTLFIYISVEWTWSRIVGPGIVYICNIYIHSKLFSIKISILNATSTLWEHLFSHTFDNIDIKIFSLMISQMFFFSLTVYEIELHFMFKSHHIYFILSCLYVCVCMRVCICPFPTWLLGMFMLVCMTQHTHIYTIYI